MKHLLAGTAALLALATAVPAQMDQTPALGEVVLTGDEFHATEVIGMRVHASDADPALAERFVLADGWTDIGEVNDLVVSVDGDVAAAIIGVGGFLGIGEKDVAVSMDMIRVLRDENGDRFLVIRATEATLEAAPAFDRTPFEATAMAEPALPDDDTALPADLREGYVAADPALVTTDQLTGLSVRTIDDESVGSISDFVLTEDGAIAEVIVDVGGFLGIGTKPVALDYEMLTILSDVEGDTLLVEVAATEEDLDAMPRWEG